MCASIPPGMTGNFSARAGCNAGRVPESGPFHENLLQVTPRIHAGRLLRPRRDEQGCMATALAGDRPQLLAAPGLRADPALAAVPLDQRLLRQFQHRLGEQPARRAKNCGSSVALTYQ